MATLHQKLSVVIVLGALLGLLWSGYRAYKARPLSPRLSAYGWLITAVLATQGGLGTALGLGGARPLDPTHFVFGPLTLLALPVTLLLAPRLQRRAGVVLAAGWLVTFALSLRATGTGGLTA